MIRTRLKKQNGSFYIFFAAGLLPVLLFLISLSADFAVYNRTDQKLQELADQAALLAWRHLPYQEQAITAARRFLESKGAAASIDRIGLAPARPGYSKYNDEFEVSLSQDIPLKFISYFLPQAKLQTKAVARTRATPRDIFIAMDRSFYMAAGSLGENFVNQEMSSFLRDNTPFIPFVEHQGNTLVSTAPGRFMTQLCFNSFFSGFKNAAINLYEYFSAAGRNGVGVGVFPGIGSEGLRVVRPLLSASQNVLPDVNGEALPLQISESHLDQDYYVYDAARLGASSWCAGAAANELSSEMRTPDSYETLGQFNKLWTAGSNSDPRDIIETTNGQIAFNQDYQPFLKVKEVIWSAVVKNSTPDMKFVLDSVLVNLFSGPEYQNVLNASLRAGLSGTATKTAVILAGDVPYVNGQRFKQAGDLVSENLKDSINKIKPVLASNPQQKLKIIYIILNDPSRYAAPDEVQERTAELDDVFNQFLSESEEFSRLKIEVIYSEDLESLTEKVLAYSILDDNNKVLAY